MELICTVRAVGVEWGDEIVAELMIRSGCVERIYAGRGVR